MEEPDRPAALARPDTQQRQRRSTSKPRTITQFRSVDSGSVTGRHTGGWPGSCTACPTPRRAILEELFGEPVTRLLGPPYGVAALRGSGRHNEIVTRRVPPAPTGKAR